MVARPRLLKIVDLRDVDLPTTASAALTSRGAVSYRVAHKATLTLRSHLGHPIHVDYRTLANHMCRHSYVPLQLYLHPLGTLPHLRPGIPRNLVRDRHPLL